MASVKPQAEEAHDCEHFYSCQKALINTVASDASLTARRINRHQVQSHQLHRELAVAAIKQHHAFITEETEPIKLTAQQVRSGLSSALLLLQMLLLLLQLLLQMLLSLLLLLPLLLPLRL